LGFSADAYLQYSSAEKWDTIPAGKRDTRDTLVAAANAYLDAFLEQKKELVPWGYPCNRTEGGSMHTGRGAADDSCDVGVPSGVNIANRRFVVDETIGSVVVVLHLRRRKRSRRQRCARFSPLPRGEWQAALRPHTHASVAGEFPGRRGARPRRWPARRTWRTRRGQGLVPGGGAAAEQSAVVMN